MKYFWILKRAAFIFYQVRFMGLTPAQAAIAYTLSMMEKATAKQLGRGMNQYKMIDDNGDEVRRIHRVK